MSRLRYRQVFLFLVVLILPTAAIGWQGWRLVRQERDLDRSRAEKQAEETRKRIAASIGHDLFEQLERIKVQEIANSPASIPEPGKYSNAAAVVLVGGVDGERLVWPWDDDPVSAPPRPADDPEFDQKMRDAGRAESGEKNYERAVALYRTLADAAGSEAQRAEARLGLARTLRQNDSPAESAGVLRDVLDLPWSVTDASGIPFATYAAGGLIKSNLSRDVLQRVKRDLESPTTLTSNLAGQLKSVLDALNASSDRSIREEAAAALERLSSRMRNLEQARNLKEARDLQRDFAGLRVELPAEAVTTADGGSELRRSFYGLSLFVVVPLTFLGGYLLWRDTRRESRVAEMRSQFVSSVSHELKTPLTSIRMFAETLQMADETHTSDVKVRTEYLDTIVSESERLTRLLNNVLDFSRIERDQKTYHMEAADLPEVVGAAVKTMRFPLSEQGFALQVEICDDLPSLQMDRDAIEQAVLNLLSNAMKYSGTSRDIGLKLSRQNGCALIQVSDHGVGIAPAEQRRIFDRFYRVNSRENRAISGTGLGLALVAHIAEAHKGRVEVESKVGEGSTFSIRIPVNGSGAS